MYLRISAIRVNQLIYRTKVVVIKDNDNEQLIIYLYKLSLININFLFTINYLMYIIKYRLRIFKK
jgi:hypothetical protein